jgi:hypothetical protein
MARPPGPRGHPRRAASPARPLRRLLQPPAAAPGHRPPHSGRRLERPAPGHPRAAGHPRQRALPGPPRPRRRRRQAHPAPQQPAPPHRHRPPLGRHQGPHPRPRPRPANHHPRRWRTHPRAHPGPQPGLPAPNPQDMNHDPRHLRTMSRDITRVAKTAPNPRSKGVDKADIACRAATELKLSVTDCPCPRAGKSGVRLAKVITANVIPLPGPRPASSSHQRTRLANECWAQPKAIRSSSSAGSQTGSQ